MSDKEFLAFVLILAALMVLFSWVSRIGAAVGVPLLP